MTEKERRIKALEEKVETIDMLTQRLKTELEKALEEIEVLSDGLDRETIRKGLSDL